MYVITGATGNIGKVVADTLLDAGKSVTVINRKEEKLKDFVAKGAKPAAGDLDDAAFLTKVFTGATAAFVLIPGDFLSPDIRAFQNKIGKSITEAVKKSGIKNVVVISSVGAHLTEGSGVIQGLHDFENMLSEVADANILFLRPCYFMQNFYGSIGMIKHMGINGGSTSGDIKIPMVHTNDIGKVASERLLALTFKGKSHEYILGNRDLTYKEATTIIGNAIGKPELPYVQFPYDQAKAGMIQNGLSESMADGFNEMAKAVNEGKLFSDAVRTPANTTKTTFEEFAKEFAGAYQHT